MTSTMDARPAAGFVRRCHGDLHLGNIALLDDGPVLFDAIEFDPAMATQTAEPNAYRDHGGLKSND